MSDKSTEVIQPLFCKKCKKTISLREMDIKEDKIKCKKCKSLLLEIKD